MAITTNASLGLIVTTAAMNESLPTQSEQTGSNTVVVSDDLASLSNGNLESSPTYIDRLMIIRQGAGDEETRRIVSDVAGTGTLRILGTNEDWSTVPASSDTIHVSYIIQDAATLTGLTLVNKTVQDFSSGRRFSVGTNTATFAYMAFIDGVGLQLDDNSSTTVASMTIDSDGRLDCGYIISGTPTSGMKMQGAMGLDGELMIEVISGGEFNCFASYIDSVNRELVDFNTSTTSKIRMLGVRWTFPINDVLWGVQDSDINDVAFLSDGAGTTPRIRLRDISSGNEFKNLVANGFDGFESNTSGDDPVVRNILFTTMSKLLTIATAETWTLVNSIMTIGTADQVDVSIAGTGELLRQFSFDNFSHDLADVALTAKHYVVNATSRGGAGILANEDTGDSGGLSRQDVETERYVDSGGTALTLTTSSNFAEISTKYGHLPIIKNIDPANEDETTSPIQYGKAIDYAHSVDDWQVEATRATAEAVGDGGTGDVAIEVQTNPAVILKWTGGTGTLAVNDIIDNDNNGAQATLVEIIEGDSVAGTGVFDSANATAFVDTAQALSDTPSAGDWDATYTSASLKEYDWLIDATTLSAQQLYDYLNAKVDEPTLITASPKFMDDLLIWAIDGTNALPFTGVGLSPNTFQTEREVGKTAGWAIYNLSGGLGSIVGYTSNDGTQFIPASTVNVTIHCEEKVGGADSVGVQVLVTLVSDGSDVSATDVTDSNGDYSFSYTYTGDVNVNIDVRKGTADPLYIADNGVNTITSTGMSQTFLMVIDTNNAN